MYNCNACKHEFEPKETYDRGSRWKHHNGEIYILATTDSKRAALISLYSGNVWTRAVECKNTFQLTDEEWYRVTSGKPEHFKGVGEFK